MKLSNGRFGHVILSRSLRYEFRCYNATRRSMRVAATMCSSMSKSGSDFDSLANGSNANYVDRLYSKWWKNPSSVHESWDAYFKGKPHTTSAVPGPTKKSFKFAAVTARGSSSSAGSGSTAAPPADWKYIDDHLAVQAIIRAYQTRGHLAADLDPLGIVGPTGHSLSTNHKKLQSTQAVLRQHFSYSFNDLNALFKLPNSTLIGGDEQFLPLKEILERLERIYCGHIGVEYMMITSFFKSNWIRENFEVPGAIKFSPDEKKLILERLTRSTGFENFLAKKFSSEKRFGLEGCDTLIPVLKEIVDQSVKLNVESVYIGMAHRGRLNVLANVCRKPIVDILSQFNVIKARDGGSGDVKYHLGVFSDRQNRLTNKNVRITVVANPSHLEFVNPVLLGKARADMHLRGDYQGNKVLPIILHGDASFCGQGVVYESIHLSDLPAYTTHGTIHVVVNNQVGFTTDPRFSRSSRYCTDVARVLNAPIFHVNADDPEACVHCARVASKWRAKFHNDVVIDIVGYRRNGHNEADEPMFTQPLMYQRIRKLKNCTVKYADKLVKEGVIKMEEYKEMVSKYDKICNEAFEEAKKIKTFKHSSWVDSPWPAYFQGRDRLKMCPTGVNLKAIHHIGKIYSSLPPPEQNFEVHKGILRILGLRKKMMEECVADWSLGEAFAFGTLLKDGVHVRLSGQDVERGTFSHRHHVLHHQSKDNTRYNSLQHLYPDQAQYEVCNSSLSECAVMGFDLGFSMANPYTLVIWEAQFGDFANTAQPIIDTFLASGETKWVRQSGLVLFLPHAMEGMGPEHSSARIERYLQLSDDDPDCFPDLCDPDFVARQLMEINWFVTNVTTPANLFHVLRRQVALSVRKPLINFSPKSLLRHPLAKSPFSDFDECSTFHRLIPEKGKAAENAEGVKKLIFCSGKVYYDMVREREDHEQDETVAIARVEQLCPFPYDLVVKEIEKYKEAELIWLQEEHKNQGAWSYVQPRFDTTIVNMENEKRVFGYYGRPPNSASATGNKVQHYNEYKTIVRSIFGKFTEANKLRLKCIKEEIQQKAKQKSQESLAKAKAKKAEKDAGPKAASSPAGQAKPKKSAKEEPKQASPAGQASPKKSAKEEPKQASPAGQASPKKSAKEDPKQASPAGQANPRKSAKEDPKQASPAGQANPRKSVKENPKQASPASNAQPKQAARAAPRPAKQVVFKPKKAEPPKEKRSKDGNAPTNPVKNVPEDPMKDQ